jgi:glycerophosphoryl diester phosphodiesterase
LIATASAACAPHSPRPTDSLFAKGVTVIGHRGAAGLAPENTDAAFAVAKDLGVPFELDVTLSADGVVVVIHDDALERTTNGAGYVDETPWANIKDLDAGVFLDPKWEGQRVPRLDEVLRTYAPHVVVNVEIKSPREGKPPWEVAKKTIAAIDAAGARDRVFVTSFSPYVLAACREYAPDIPRGQLYGTFKGADLKFYEKWVLRNLLLNGKAVPDLLVAEAPLLRPRYVAKMKDRGYRVLAWTVNEPAEMKRLVEMGVDGIITDRPDLALDVVGR